MDTEKKDVTREDVENALDGLRANLQADGGDITFVEMTSDYVVKVKFMGACACCPGASATLKFYIERLLKEKLPQIKEVVMV